MTLIPFPDVPVLPGVPPIPRLPGAVSPTAQFGLGLLTGILWQVAQNQSQWGIFDSSGNPLGNPGQFIGLAGNLLTALGANSAPGGIANTALQALGITSSTSTNSVDYSKETRVSDFPLEQGSFANYNKVEMSAIPIVTLCYDANESARSSFLKSVDAACKSTNLYSIVTPEVTYINYTIERYNYQRRAARGATLLIVEIHLKEIRQVSAQYSAANPGNVNQPQNPSATPSTSNGVVQPTTPQTSSLKAIANKLGVTN